MPTSLAGAHANTSRCFLTLLVVAQHLPEAAPFKMGPQATLAYINILWQVAMYRGMTLERYMTYRSESLRGITARYNKCEESMHDVLAFAQKMLYEDMSNYLKLLSHVALKKKDFFMAFGNPAFGEASSRQCGEGGVDV